MGTRNSFYVRVSDVSTFSITQQKFPERKIEQGEDFLGIVLDRDAFEPPHNQLVSLSVELNTDVMWLSFQSVVDAFEFHHWQAGKVLRSLVFGCYEAERTWEFVEGEPEHWERAVFFDPETLSRLLEYVETVEEKQELRRIWNEARLLCGYTEPSIDARESARMIAEHYNFPGWS